MNNAVQRTRSTETEIDELTDLDRTGVDDSLLVPQALSDGIFGDDRFPCAGVR